ncbi:uncharacterized protein LOC127723923 [Mytilus californianus]|uniref:uncharacterized protein LOC127723923 n=1 Tax=Mytilus californianus TaxID=6549 RepID=UPI002247A13D|nr:uncharacterized protein LOC127723923 [Mytilus californianus]
MAEDMLWIILLACVLDIKSVIAHSFPSDRAIHTDSKTWKAASFRCGNNGLEFDKKTLKNIAMLQDKEFWIGMAIYRISTSWIEILGTKHGPSIVSCQKQCESYQFFGYSESTKKCFCQHNKDNERNSYNISGCIEENDSNYSFVYKVFTGHVSNNGDGECTTLFCKTGSNGLKSANCNDDTNTARISRCNDGYKVGWGKPYLTSKQLCLERFQLLLPPETYCQTNNHTFEGIPSWTNVFRAKTEAKLIKAEAGTKELLFCLVGTITEKGVLHITRRACNDKLQFVCRIDKASTISSQSVITTTSMDKDSSASFAIDLSHLVTIYPNYPPSTTKNQNHHNISSPNSTPSTTDPSHPPTDPSTTRTHHPHGNY